MARKMGRGGAAVHKSNTHTPPGHLFMQGLSTVAPSSCKKDFQSHLLATTAIYRPMQRDPPCWLCLFMHSGYLMYSVSFVISCTYRVRWSVTFGKTQMLVLHTSSMPLLTCPINTVHRTQPRPMVLPLIIFANLLFKGYTDDTQIYSPVSLSLL